MDRLWERGSKPSAFKKMEMLSCHLSGSVVLRRPKTLKASMIVVRLSILCLLLLMEVSAIPFALSSLDPLYVDDEVTALWESFSNSYEPSAEDYKKLENYLKYGRRDYLDVMIDFGRARGIISAAEAADRPNCCWKRLLQRMKFTGPNEELPTFQTFVLGGASPQDKSRCVVLYASFNPDTFDLHTPYSNRVKEIIGDLQTRGFRGHVLVRTGGYPLVSQGGLRLAHVPYSFKILSLIEASLMGYDDVLWLDCSIHPLNDLSAIFSGIRERGALLLHSGMQLDYDYGFSILPDEAIQSAGLTVQELYKIPHIIATIIGISFKNEKAHELIAEWLRLTRLVYPAMTLYPEEFLLTVASWRTGWRPRPKDRDHIGHYLEVRSVTPTKPKNSRKPFWMDKS